MCWRRTIHVKQDCVLKMCVCCGVVVVVQFVSVAFIISYIIVKSDGTSRQTQRREEKPFYADDCRLSALNKPENFPFAPPGPRGRSGSALVGVVLIEVFDFLFVIVVEEEPAVPSAPADFDL